MNERRRQNRNVVRELHTFNIVHDFLQEQGVGSETLDTLLRGEDFLLNLHGSVSEETMETLIRLLRYLWCPYNQGLRCGFLSGPSSPMACEKVRDIVHVDPSTEGLGAFETGHELSIEEVVLLSRIARRTIAKSVIAGVQKVHLPCPED